MLIIYSRQNYNYSHISLRNSEISKHLYWQILTFCIQKLNVYLEIISHLSNLLKIKWKRFSDFFEKFRNFEAFDWYWQILTFCLQKPNTCLERKSRFNNLLKKLWNFQAFELTKTDVLLLFPKNLISPDLVWRVRTLYRHV